MRKSLRRLAVRYAWGLASYLSDRKEVSLQRALELGRAAIAQGVGVLEVARLHQQALVAAFDSGTVRGSSQSVVRTAEPFLLEALSPFEATHRGFRETNRALQRVIATLKERNVELERINRLLEREIGERKRTEDALRQSEEHHRQLFQEAQLMQERLRKLSRQVLNVQEEERKRISRELHDEVGQTMTAISVNLEVLKHNNQADPEFCQRIILDTQGLLSQTTESVHRFARELRPAMLDDLGLLPALRSQIKAFSVRTGLDVRFRANPIVEQMNSDQKTALFRIMQESLTNVAKHARAKQVWVTIRKLKDAVRMEIADNGRAFNAVPGNLQNGKTRLGLLGMQERVRLVNGAFSVKANPGSGTTVRVLIPFAPARLSTSPRRNAQRAKRPLPGASGKSSHRRPARQGATKV